MATQNLLKASFNGKLGKIYGTKEYGKRYVKAIPFSHAPHSRTQTQCVRAFEILNRISARVAKDYFNHLPLSSRKMSKMNAVAQFLKPLVKNHVFEGENITDVFGTNETFTVSGLNFDTVNKRVVFFVQNIIDTQFLSDNEYFCGLFTENGYTLSTLVESANSFDAVLEYDSLWYERLFFFVFRTAKRSGKLVLLSAVYMSPDGAPVVGGVFYTDRIRFASIPSYSNKIIYFPQENSSVLDETIIITE